MLMTDVNAMFRTGNLAVIEMFSCWLSPAICRRPHLSSELGGILYSTKICVVQWFTNNYSFVAYCSHKSNWIYKPREN